MVARLFDWCIKDSDLWNHSPPLSQKPIAGADGSGPGDRLKRGCRQEGDEGGSHELQYKHLLLKICRAVNPAVFKPSAVLTFMALWKHQVPYARIREFMEFSEQA